MSKKLIVIVCVIVGLLFIGLAVVYFITPANALPQFLPGYSAQLTKHHLTHAIASLCLGILAFVVAWFQTGKKSSHKSEQQAQSEPQS